MLNHKYILGTLWSKSWPSPEEVKFQHGWCDLTLFVETLVIQWCLPIYFSCMHLGLCISLYSRKIPTTCPHYYKLLWLFLFVFYCMHLCKWYQFTYIPWSIPITHVGMLSNQVYILIFYFILYLINSFCFLVKLSSRH